MTMTRKLALSVGLCAVLSGAAPVFAQFDGSEPDPDLIQFAGIDEITVADLGMPVGPPLFIAGGPPGGPGRDGPGGPGGPGRCPMTGGCGPFSMLEGDNALTDEQYEKLYEIKGHFMDKAGVQKAELKSSERQMRDLMVQVKIDKAKVKDLQAKINEQRNSLSNLRLDERLASLDVLTEAQRKELRSKMVKGGGPGGRMMMRHMRKHASHG